MKSRPTVSVSIVTYNSAEDIASCLEAVLGQTYPIERIVVVDNGSSDGTMSVLERFRDRIQIIANKDNTGFAGGQNLGIGATGSDYVLVLNPDVTLEPDYVETIIGVMEANPDIGSATGMLVRTSAGDVIDSTGLVLNLTRRARDRGAGEPPERWQDQGEVFGVSGAAAIYSRRMIDDISINGEFFDSFFFAYKEDVDLAYRANRLGWKAMYVPSARALHKRGWKEGGRRAIPLFVRRHSYQNQFFVWIKNETFTLQFVLSLPVLLVLELLRLGYILVREPGLLACWFTIAKAFPDMLRKRKEISRKVKRKAHFC